MRIERLHIEGFRNISEAEIEFRHNGSGGGMTLLDETTGGRWTLDAIQIATGPFLRQMPFTLGCTFQRLDGPQPRLDASFTLKPTDAPVEVRREAFTGRNGKFLTTVKDAMPLKEYAEKCRVLRFDAEALLPLFAFNGAKRRWSWIGDSGDENMMQMDRLAIFSDASTQDAGTGMFGQWFIELWYSMNDQRVKRSQRSLLFDSPRLTRYEELHEAVRDAVNACMRFAYIRGLYYDIDAKELRVRGNGEWTSIGRMPKDEVAVLGAVADLACRCCILNRDRGGNALKSTRGIVLLDWTELRARWLPQTLDAMRAAFPRLQFIVALSNEMAGVCRNANFSV